VLIVRATGKLLQRLGRPTLREGEGATTLLGQWYATALFWRPQVALLVNEPTLLPILIPLAPATTLLARIPQQIAAALSAHGAPASIVDEEVRRMRDWRLGPTANRSVVAIMNEFTYLAEAWRQDQPQPDLHALALRLASRERTDVHRVITEDVQQASGLCPGLRVVAGDGQGAAVRRARPGVPGGERADFSRRGCRRRGARWAGRRTGYIAGMTWTEECHPETDVRPMESALTSVP
jgi:hypothetical protein